MKGGDISNLSSPQLVVFAEVVCELVDEKSTKLLSRKITKRLGVINALHANALWNLGNNYGVSIELAGYGSEGWTEDLLEALMERLDRRVVNPFNYTGLYEDPAEFLSMLPYRANLRGVVDVPTRVARYGSAGVEIQNL